jgi:TonB-linked SusC/RagA family outer membrane protein
MLEEKINSYKFADEESKRILRFLMISIFIFFLCIFTTTAENVHSQQRDFFPKNISLSEKQAEQQKKQITGKVTDANGESIIGANIIEVGTTNGTITDFDGSFSLQVEDNAIIHISYISYLDQDISTVGRVTFNIVLQEDTKTLEEVVVTAFATQKRINVTGAISTVDGNEIATIPVANVSSALVGMTPGLSAVTISGEPGQDAAEIAIRGISSYSGNTSPLIVIDGIEQPANQAMTILNSMDPNDILGLSILKDASSTAVYGIRAANGVIIVTTRRGQVGSPKVSFSSNFGFTSATNLQKGLSSYEYALFRNEAIRNEVDGFGNTPLLNYLFNEDDLWKFQNNRDFTPAEVGAMNLSPEQKEKLLNSPALYYGSSDAYAELYSRTAPQWQSNINVSGGTERVKYFVSLGYLDQQSIMKTIKYFDVNTGSRYQRFNLRANIDVDVLKNTTLSVNSMGQFGMTQGPGTGSLYSRYSGIMQIIYEGNPFTNKSEIMDGKLISNYNYPTNSVQDELRRRTDSEISGSWLNTLLGRPLGITYNTLVDYTIRLKHDMPYLVKGLYAQASFRYQENFNRVITQTTAIPTYTVRRSQVDPNVYEFFGGGYGADSFSSGTYGGMRDFYLDASLNYQGTFGLHSIGVLALGRATKYTMPRDEYNTPNGLIGTSARVTYDYDTRYMVEANVAYNGTENFAKENRFGLFPAFSFGWVASNESFFPKNDLLTFLKIRGSYGIVGNDQIGGRRYLYLPGVYSINTSPGSFEGTDSGSSGGRYYQFGTSTGSVNPIYRGSTEGSLGNPDVTWEKSTKTSIGLEVKFLKDRLSLVADYFNEDRKDILTTLGVIPTTFGLASGNTSPVNIGQVNNKGYEAVLEWNERIGDVSYYIEGNVTYAKNRIIYMAEAPNPYDWMNQTGHSIGQYFGYKTDGYYNTLDELNSRPFFLPLNNAVTLGDIKYLDLNGDAIIDNKDMAPIGYPNRPQIQFAGKIGFSYKGFDVRALFSGTAQGTYYIARITSPFFKRAGNAFRWQYEGRWTPEKVAAGEEITYPRAVYNADENHYNFGPSSDHWTLSSDHLRLKNLEIGYRFPSSSRFLKRVGMSSLRVYVTTNNVFTLFNKMKDYGIDPETKDNIGGYEGNISYVFPLTRTTMFGFNVQF